MGNEKVPLQSEKGKEILAYATSREYCILEFAELDNGEMSVADITDHVEELEEQVFGS